MAFLWGTVSVLVAIIWIVTIVDLLRAHLGAGKTSAWLLLVIILPFIGALIYWSVRPTTAEDQERAAAAEAERRRGAPGGGTFMNR